MSARLEPSGPASATIATLATVGTSMPAFLIGASAPFLVASLGIGNAMIGGAVASYFVASASTSSFGGRIAERIGAGRSFVMSGTVSAACVLGMSTVGSIGPLLALLFVAGIMNGVSQPASNLAVARYVRRRQAFVFAAKQSAILIATLLAGASVPLISIRLGWEWSFRLAGLFLVAVVLAAHGVFRGERSADRALGTAVAERIEHLWRLVALAAGVAIGIAAATGLASFLVLNGVEVGLGTATAGWLLSASSGLAIVTRLIIGWLMDHQPQRALPSVGVMMIAASAGYLLLASASVPGTVVGGLVAYAFSWGWTGLVMFAVARAHPAAVGRTTGIIQAGMGLGSATGPWLFGTLSTTVGFATAWRTLGALSVIAGLGVLLVARSFGGRPVGGRG